MKGDTCVLLGVKGLRLLAKCDYFARRWSSGQRGSYRTPLSIGLEFKPQCCWATDFQETRKFLYFKSIQNVGAKFAVVRHGCLIVWEVVVIFPRCDPGLAFIINRRCCSENDEKYLVSSALKKDTLIIRCTNSHCLPHLSLIIILVLKPVKITGYNIVVFCLLITINSRHFVIFLSYLLSFFITFKFYLRKP